MDGPLCIYSSSIQLVNFFERRKSVQLRFSPRFLIRVKPHTYCYKRDNAFSEAVLKVKKGHRLQRGNL